jgi:hypothetical protein
MGEKSLIGNRLACPARGRSCGGGRRLIVQGRAGRRARLKAKALVVAGGLVVRLGDWAIWIPFAVAHRCVVTLSNHAGSASTLRGEKAIAGSIR